jgi:histidine triad (HIT) family protein
MNTGRTSNARCIFCDILAGEGPASVVYRDDVCCALMDLYPVNPGHVLVVPTGHAASLAELDEETGAHVFKTAQRIAAALRRSGVKCQGVNLYLADGRAAGQEVLHVHLHVIPRYRGDGFRFQFGPHYGRRPTRAELDQVADRIRSTLSGQT